MDPKVLEFVQNIYQFKNSTSEPPRGWLDYAIQFRYRTATKPRDKLIGFQGLLQPSVPDGFPLDHKKRDVEIFADFTRSYINRDQSLALLALAEAHSPFECTWAVDWSMLTSSEYDDDPFFSNAQNPRDHVQLLWSGGLIPSPIAHLRKYPLRDQTGV